MSEINCDKERYIADINRNRVFTPPFKCYCCGKVISSEQFKFSGLCPYCDIGTCAGMSKHEEEHNQKNWKYAEEFVG